MENDIQSTIDVNCSISTADVESFDQNFGKISRPNNIISLQIPSSSETRTKTIVVIGNTTSRRARNHLSMIDDKFFVIDCRRSIYDKSGSDNNIKLRRCIGVVTLPTVLERRVLKGSVSAYMSLETCPLRQQLMSCKNACDWLVILLTSANTHAISRSHEQINNTANMQEQDGDLETMTLLLLKQLRKDGFKTNVFSGSVKSLSARHPNLTTEVNQVIDCDVETTVESTSNSQLDSNPDGQLKTRLFRPSELGPLHTLEKLKLSESSTPDSCFSSPETSKSPNKRIMKARGPRSLACSAPILPSLFDGPPLDDAFPYHEYVKERSFSRLNSAIEPVQILPFLYLGNAQNSADRTILDKLGIRYILNVTPNLKNWFEQDLDADFKYMQIPIDDHWSQNLASYFPKAIEFIENARAQRSGVLVHCVAGISRSVTVTVAYLMQQLGKSMEDAYDLVKQQKPNIAPNFNFMGQLLEFQNELKHKNVDNGFESGSSSSSSAKSFHFLEPKPKPNAENNAQISDKHTQLIN